MAGVTESQSPSPCLTCATTSCCRVLEVCKLTIEGPTGLAELRRLLDLQRVELGLWSEGVWSVLVQARCQRLTASGRRCSVWGTDLQPTTCRKYDEWDCWYADVFDRDVTSTHVRLSPPRLARIESRLAPLAEGLGLADLGAASGELRTLPPPAPGARRPCDDRCSVVRVRRKAPQTLDDLEHLRYVVGFEGVELHVDPSGWRVAVHTRRRDGEPPEPEHGQLFEVMPCAPFPGRVLDYWNIDSFIERSRAASGM